MKELHKRSRNPKYKKKYKVTNWKEYEQGLKRVGKLELSWGADIKSVS